MKYRLGDIAEISAGQGAPQGEKNYCDDGIPFVKAGNLQELLLGVNIVDIQKVSEDVAKKHKLKLYKQGSVLFAKSGMSCLKGYIYVLPIDAYVVSHLACVTPLSVDSDYLRYYFQFHKPSQLVKDTAYPSISLSDIADMKIEVPGKEKIKNVIASLKKPEKIIAAHKQQLAALDTLVKARFVELFGDPVSNSKGLSTLKGEAFFKLSNGKFIPESKRFAEGIPAYGGNGVSWYTDEVMCYEDTLVVGRVGFQSGNIHLAKAPLSVTDNAMYMSRYDKDKYNIIFLYSLMEHIDFTRYQDAGDLKKITQKPFMGMDYIHPPILQQEEYAAFVARVDKSKVAVQKALDEAQLLFDSLMQQYFG